MVRCLEGIYVGRNAVHHHAVNVSKTKCMVLSRGYVNTDNFGFTFQKNHLEMVSTYKYLGLHMGS